MNTNNKKKITSKQIVALLGVAALVLLYVVTLFVAIFDTSSSGTWFFLCMIATLVVPLLIWIYTWMYGMLSGKHTIASFDLEKSAETDEGPADQN